MSGPGPKLFASNCSDCTKTCTTHPLATILSSNDDIVVTINWSSLRTCVKFVSLTKHQKGSRITSFVFGRNGQWDTYQKCKKRKLTTDVITCWEGFETFTYGTFDVDHLFCKKNSHMMHSWKLLDQTRLDHHRPGHIRLTVQRPNCLSIPTTPQLKDIWAIFETFCTLP